jgi:exopolysaccharide biosynthesis polyprenyl glycosylphosphotransferase
VVPTRLWEVAIRFQNETVSVSNLHEGCWSSFEGPPSAKSTIKRLKPSFWVSVAFGVGEGLGIFIVLSATLYAMRGAAKTGLATWMLLVGLPVANGFLLSKRRFYLANQLLFFPVQPLRLTGSWIEAFGASVLLSAVVRSTEPIRFRYDIDFFAPQLAALFAAGLATMLAIRLGWTVLRRPIAAKAMPRVMFVGRLGASRSRRLMSQLSHDRTIRLVSSVDYDDLLEGRGDYAQDGPRDGAHNTHPLATLLQRERIDTIIIPIPQIQDDQVAEINATARMCGVTTLAIPGASVKCDLAPAITTLGRLSMIRTDHALDGFAEAQKRIADLILGGMILVLLAPIMAMIAASIRLDSRGPIFFRQLRVGRGGVLFEILKFRTMYHQDGVASETGPAIVSAELQTSRGDKRITRVGAFLRRHSLDELPQIFNVLKGDMSIVGPRPHAAAMTVAGVSPEDLVPSYTARFAMRPGITGWAQINGRRGIINSLETLQKRVDCDLYYVENWSLGLDLKISIRTLACLINDKQAF